MKYEIKDNNNHSLTLIHLHLVENYLFIPALTISNLGLVYLCYRNAFKNKKTATSLHNYDHILYHPNTLCRTCQAPKPARSKHCSVCQECIPAMDHHCIWLNACVSQSNLVYFDTLLLVNLCSLLYISTRSGLMIKSLNQQFVTFLKNSTSDKGALLIIDGMSSSESDKWFVIHSLIYDGFVYKINHKYYVVTEDSKKDGSFNKFNSINFYDGKVYTFDHSMKDCLVESPEEIINIYDKGTFIENLKERWSL
ncbi:unnamed protein product [Hanseniaspora opuntiae]